MSFEKENWFGESLFNLIIDYYPEITCRPYGSGATRENILPVLKDLQPGFVLIYAKGHSGRTTFRSALKTEHVMLDKNMPKFFREVTRETGTKLFLYYSGLVDGLAGIRNPDWRMKDRTGKPIALLDEMYLAYPICSLSAYFDEWVSVHLKEMFDIADPDGIWVDGDWPGPCYCYRCQERFKNETGMSGLMPEIKDTLSPEGIAWNNVWGNITSEWRTRFSSMVKSLKPACLYSSGNVNPRKEFAKTFDWRSGDWFSPNNHRLMQTISMRRYTTQGIPYDTMTCDTSYVHAWHDMRSHRKTLQRMLQEGAGVLANGGQWCYWTYPMPNGALIPSKMRNARISSEFARKRKTLVLHTESINWTAVLDTAPNSAPDSLSNPHICGSAKAMIFCHKSPDIIDDSQISEDMAYELIVLPAQNLIKQDTVYILEEFVKRGGNIISSGDTILSPEFQNLLGVKMEKKNALSDGHILLKDKDPASIFANWDKLKLISAEELYPLYTSWDHYNPEMRNVPYNYPITGLMDEENPEKAGFPAAVIRNIGKGTIIHIATNFFDVYWRYGYPDMLKWFKEILDIIQPNPFFKTSALSFVEIALRKKGNDLLVHFVNGNPGKDLSCINTQDLWVDDIPAVGPINVEIRCSKNISKTRWEPGGKEAKCMLNNGILTTILDHLEIHTCLVVEDYFS